MQVHRTELGHHPVHVPPSRYYLICATASSGLIALAFQSVSALIVQSPASQQERWDLYFIGEVIELAANGRSIGERPLG
jgi:hypothetical protein